MSLFTNHDILNVHKLLGFGCLAHYGFRFYFKVMYGSMYFQQDLSTYLTPVLHLSLSLSSFMFPIPTYRFESKVIIWRELQLHNIIFTSRSVFMMYHTMMFKELNAFYYYSRLGIIVFHHYLADFVTGLYQQRDKTTTRDIPYDSSDSKSKTFEFLNKKFYAISQLIATSNLLLSNNCENGFSIMFPIQLSTFLMTLVRKNIISNTSWHFWYALSLTVPYLVNYNIVYTGNDKVGISLVYVFARLGLGMDKYLNMFLLTSAYNFLVRAK